MKRTLPLLFLIFIIFSAKAQQQSAPGSQPYGKVDMADLEMKSCDFEPDANAEVLFDKGSIGMEYLDRHIRIKIFSQAGVNEGNIRLFYSSRSELNDLKAETINLVDGKIQITVIDKKSFYIQKINKLVSMITFTFPDVKPGSIIEYKYFAPSPVTWYFQSHLPTRYSEVEAAFDPRANIKHIPYTTQPFVKSIGGPFDSRQVRAMANVHSLQAEPYMGARERNLERLEFLGINPYITSWKKMGEILMAYDDFGGQLDKNLKGGDVIVKAAQKLSSTEEKVAYIFNQVKTDMKWNENMTFGSSDGISLAWDKKVGNSAEINMILFDFLKKAGVDVYPLLVSTKSHGKINPYNPNLFSFNGMDVFVPVDTTDANNQVYFVLDASSKFNLYNIPPKEELNSFGLMIDKERDKVNPVFIEETEPSRQSVSVDADIKPEGKMDGTATISNSGYNKIENDKRYKTAGETKFIDTLTDNNNDLKVLSLQLENAEIDSLPLIENVKFTLNLSESDADYIYFNPNLFITPHKNPFISETRYSDIDFGYYNNAVISGNFKIPAGYKSYALPPNIRLIMPDTSIICRRVINEQDGNIITRYSIVFKKSIYFRNDYAEIHEFFKKMYEMLNEQIVLKKL